MCVWGYIDKTLGNKRLLRGFERAVKWFNVNVIHADSLYLKFGCVTHSLVIW